MAMSERLTNPYTLRSKYYEKNCGMLHRVKFFRIVLDEAQAIKNHMSATSMACRALKGIHHWAITGTPILNTVKEFYPYFKFLKEPHTGSYRIFKHNFCSPDDPDGTEKLSVFLRKIMIRRTHLDRLFDARLLGTYIPYPSCWIFVDLTKQTSPHLRSIRFGWSSMRLSVRSTRS